MSFVSSLLDPSKGAGFQAGSANVLNAADPSKVATTDQNAANALAQQQAFVQSINAANPLAQQQAILQQQQALTGQLQGVANGTGPNPAQAMLNQATGANVANQAALAAGQRGAAGNVGLMARQAGQTGAGIQQQAVGQGATMQANQSLNAINAAGNLANQQAGQQIGQVNANTASQQAEQQNLLNSIAGANNANVSSQNSINAANSQLANTRAGQQGGALGGVLNALGPVASLAGGALTGGISSLLGAGAAAGGLTGGGGGSTGGGSNASTQRMAAYAEGGSVGPTSAFGKLIHGHVPMMAEGGVVPALVSPGERYLPPSEVTKVAEGKKAPMQAGEEIPGKPMVGGAKNDYSNDTVKKDLKEGGIILPREVTKASDADKKAQAFVAAILANKGKGMPTK